MYFKNLSLKETFTLKVNLLLRKKLEIKPIVKPKKPAMKGFEETKRINK